MFYTVQYKMKKRILYIALAVIFIVALELTAMVGLKVDLNYAEGYTVTFTVGKEISIKDIQEIADEIWGKNKTLVQSVEMFKDSALIKTRENITEDKIETLCNKLQLNISLIQN